MVQKTIVCRDIVKRFGDGENAVYPLNGVTFAAYAGELILLMGPSGSGKTTLISIIAGLMGETRGTCYVLDTAINELSTTDQIAFRGNNIGFIYQHFNLVSTLTAHDNVVIPLLLRGMPRKRAYDQGAELLEHMGLDVQQAHMPAQLSGGEQQRVAIARACIHEPPIILCDEPTSYLDYERGTQVMERLQEIKRNQQCTLIVVSHDHRIEQFADRIVEMERGKLRERSHKSTGRKD